MSFFGGAIKGFYQAVKNVFVDNGAPRVSVNAYGDIELASHNRALGSDQITDISPVLLARLPVTIRASAILPAAGAEDVPVPIPTGGYGYLVINSAYTPGAAGGGFQLRIQIADTVLGVDQWAEMILTDNGVFAAGTNATDGGARRRYTRYATTLNAEGGRDVIIQLGGADQVRVYAREIGVTATPGILAIYGKFSNQPIAETPRADSKSYTPATDSKRTEEISPLSQQFVPELLVNSAVLNNATYLYPSAAGASQNGYKDTSFSIYLQGHNTGPVSVTLTVEVSEDPTWTNYEVITQAGYLASNPGGGGLASYVSPSAAVPFTGRLDFDELNASYWRLRVVVSGAQNCTAIIRVKRKAL